jgi:hypothetical protein
VLCCFTAPESVLRQKTCALYGRNMWPTIHKLYPERIADTKVGNQNAHIYPGLHDRLHTLRRRAFLLSSRNEAHRSVVTLLVMAVVLRRRGRSRRCWGLGSLRREEDCVPAVGAPPSEEHYAPQQIRFRGCFCVSSCRINVPLQHVKAMRLWCCPMGKAVTAGDQTITTCRASHTVGLSARTLSASNCGIMIL